MAMMLKDFLRDDSSHSCTPSSSSSTGFPMYSRRNPGKSTVAVSSKSNKPSIVLIRSLSRKAAATKISAIHKLLQFANSLKSPAASLPRSFSRKSAKRSKHRIEVVGDVSEVKVKVKDILRWRSFRDVVEDNCSPLDFPASPNRSTTTTATTTSSCSKRSSWCDSDFTAEELPTWGGENEEFWGKKCFLDGKNAAILKNSKGDWLFEESDQQSPVSVLDSPFRDVEDFITPFLRTPNIQRQKCNLTRGNQRLNLERVKPTEEKAKELLSHVKKETKSQVNIDDDQVMLDFFMHELSINEKLHDYKFDCEILRIAKSWINGEFDEYYEWEVEEKRESFVKDMDKETCWNKFKQEREEVSKEFQIEILDDLIFHILADFITESN